MLNEIFGDISKYYIIEDANYVFYYSPPNNKMRNKCLNYSKGKNKDMVIYHPDHPILANHVKKLLYERDINIECGKVIMGFIGKVFIISFLLAAIFFVLI